MPKDREREYKRGPHFIKAINENTVDGIFSVFGVLDSYRDITHSGSFTKTFMERGDKTLHLWLHDWESPPTAKIESLEEIGRQDLPEKILQGYPEATGGALVTRTYLDTGRAKEVLAAIKAGIPLEMSFGYDVIRSEWDENYKADQEDGEEEDPLPVRHLYEVRLWETSDVLWGANPATTIQKNLLKDLQLIDIDVLLGQLDNHLTAIKDGRRNASADLERINTIALLAYELGATNVKIVSSTEEEEDVPEEDDPSKSGGEPGGAGANEDGREPERFNASTLTLLKAQLSLLEF